MRGGGGGGPSDGGGGGGGEAALGEEAAAARRPAYAKGHQGKFVKDGGEHQRVETAQAGSKACWVPHAF